MIGNLEISIEQCHKNNTSESQNEPLNFTALLYYYHISISFTITITNTNLYVRNGKKALAFILALLIITQVINNNNNNLWMVSVQFSDKDTISDEVITLKTKIMPL